jgi:hypothetical protein
MKTSRKKFARISPYLAKEVATQNVFREEYKEVEQPQLPITDYRSKSAQNARFGQPLTTVNYLHYR